MIRATSTNRVEAHPYRDAILREVLHGLSRAPKSLPCKLFYDDAGSRLFERICELEEYYLTRTELGILRHNLSEMASAIGPGSVLIEFGSGASLKTRLLLDAVARPKAYVPIDISRSALVSSVAELKVAYPSLEIMPIWGDYMQELELPELPMPARTVVFFPGSTIGNFDPPEAVRFLRRIRDLCGPDGALLIGVDLKKDRATLEAAYDDRSGVTAEFNKNILRVINRECRAHFALESFAHRAVYNEGAGRVEMHLVSELRQTVEIGFEAISFDAGEPIVTEHCYKYDVAEFGELARKAGFEPERIWTDAERRFSVQLLC